MTTESKLRRFMKPLDPFFKPFIAIYNVLLPIPVIGPVVRLVVGAFAVTGVAGLIVLGVLIIMSLAALTAVGLSELAPSSGE